MGRDHQIERYVSHSGLRIYTLPLEVFPKFWGNAYAVFGDGVALLIDTGSGLGNSDPDLLAAFAALNEQWGESATLADLQQVVITHGHTDHFGGARMVREHSDAPFVMHPLDRRVLTNYEGRLIMASKGLQLFLQRAGVPPEEQTMLMAMYGWSKGVFRSLPVEQTVEHGDRIADLFDVIHTPGHCPGQICLRHEEVLFSADHILARTSPHLAPETITPATGLEQYHRSLHTINQLDGIEIAFGGHEEPIRNLSGRVAALYASHQRKLEQILELLRHQPRTVAELKQLIHPKVEGYDVLLALEQVGAHVEYLYLRGHIRPVDLTEECDERSAALSFEVF